MMKSMEVQVELYFSEDNLSSSEDCYSPKNELLALHSILQLVNTSLSDATQPKSVLKFFRTAVVNMIHDLGNKNTLETTILEDHPCNREKSLLEWGESRGLSTKLQIACKYSKFCCCVNFLADQALINFYFKYSHF